MMYEIDRTGWENTLNIINYYCAGKPVNVLLMDRDKHITLAQTDLFHALEPYLTNSHPLMAVVLGNGKEVSLGYFLKEPHKLIIEENKLSHIKRIFIDLADERRAVLEFNQPSVKFAKPKPTVYHHDIRK
jgi:hypothetical protein